MKNKFLKIYLILNLFIFSNIMIEDVHAVSSNSFSYFLESLWEDFSLIVLYALISLIFVIPTAVSISYSNKKKSKKVETIVETMRKYKEMNISDIYNVIPDFHVITFKNTVYQMFCDIENAYMNFDYNRLNELLTD